MFCRSTNEYGEVLKKHLLNIADSLGGSSNKIMLERRLVQLNVLPWPSLPPDLKIYGACYQRTFIQKTSNLEQENS